MEELGYIICTISDDKDWKQLRKWFTNFSDAKEYANKLAVNRRLEVQVWEAIKEPPHKHQAPRPITKVYTVPS